MRKNQGFTLIELLVVIAIIALLLAIIMPSLRKAKEQAQFIICQSNLHSYGIIGVMYTAENDGEFPYPWASIYNAIVLPGEIQRYCRWHNALYDLSQYPEYGGPLWPYLEMKDANLCPKFKAVSKFKGKDHPLHVASIPIVPQFGYSMNGFLGVDGGPSDGRQYYIDKISGIKRPANVFYFAEENMWGNKWAPNVLNDNALISQWDNAEIDLEKDSNIFTDAFATFHKARDVDMNEGISNAVFVDGHVQIVEVKDTHKFAWPY
jgi:prepilin-type N-terminal cleavage/methylation domain-containing protein/prepilin-type processing-associated H-X9-DG protein